MVAPGGGFCTTSVAAGEVDAVNCAASVGVNVAVSEWVATAQGAGGQLGDARSSPRPARRSRCCAVEELTVPAAEDGVRVAFSVTDWPWSTGPAGVTASAVLWSARSRSG